MLPSVALTDSVLRKSTGTDWTARGSMACTGRARRCAPATSAPRAPSASWLSALRNSRAAVRARRVSRSALAETQSTFGRRSARRSTESDAGPRRGEAMSPERKLLACPSPPAAPPPPRALESCAAGEFKSQFKSALSISIMRRPFERECGPSFSPCASCPAERCVTYRLQSSSPIASSAATAPSVRSSWPISALVVASTCGEMRNVRPRKRAIR
mmetsp:Transcript_12676/g.32092  ORF Transcript_12676/g.32092 Transcript_12676/m.32092 type:complete len:215 (+) Transcript_12676:1395-2039(+)